MPLDAVRAGMKGEVWTVFQGTQPEPFTVEVAGVVRNALGPGKSLILCRLTDPRVQNMGAVAGMSGSPLYIDGQLAGALSYQIQRFETVHYAGFTPASDLAEVGAKSSSPGLSPTPVAYDSPRGSYQPLRPVFTISGLSPQVADLFAPRLAALGLSAASLGGSTTAADPAAPVTPLKPGSAVAVAVATGDVTLAATGSVSRLDGRHVTAFGHPLLTLGDVALPMCSAEVVAILPSNLQSIKVANTGRVIGTISQDRLSAVSGTLGAGPDMIAVDVNVGGEGTTARKLHFAVARQQQLTPTLIATGVTQAILGSNDAGLANGFRLRSNITFAAHQSLTRQSLYAGPQGFAQGLNDFVQGLAANLQNPYLKTFPDHVEFNVEPLAENPAITLDLFQLSRTTARAGETVTATLAWRDFQGAAHRQTIDVPIDSAWVGKTLDVVLLPGHNLDELSGRSRTLLAAQLRSFNAYLAAMREDREADGVYLAVLEKGRVFTDETQSTTDLPGSFERIARTADETRFQNRDALVPLWEKHLLPGKLTGSAYRRTLQVVE
ncbi:hypothetical protein K0B96_10585 [Horticoccus luteus]|uniref:Peptidase S55 domain-containing protein n=1 Tax=Horticoccus luteus TaxID=2862869 RepID=A0A8F9XK64_9BACT|nr:SpoIVB peptidase S55 domain-containing protein [Horticoccus luteus]QYM77769.1 hypothetical protein K0B96_10585 [Horticoccus luteus]